MQDAFVYYLMDREMIPVDAKQLFSSPRGKGPVILLSVWCSSTVYICLVPALLIDIAICTSVKKDYIDISMFYKAMVRIGKTDRIYYKSGTVIEPVRALPG